MERFTERVGCGADRKAIARQDRRDIGDKDCVERLAAYEDAISLERAQELTKAEKDGRLVVLPCKVGESVHGEKWMGEVAEVVINSDGISLYVRSGGGGFYCSPEDLSINAREKAEEALREKEENG